MGSHRTHASLLAEALVDGDEAETVPAAVLARKLPLERIEEIILEHREHGKRLAWSFLNHWRIRMKHDDVISVVGAALCEAANRFDEEKGVSFKTFLFYHLRGMLLKEISRLIAEQRMLQGLDHGVIADGGHGEISVHHGLSLVETNNPERIIERRESARVCWEACSHLDTLEREVLIRHYVNDESLVDIASDLNYCRCHISRVKSRALAKLSKVLKSYHRERVTAAPEAELKDQISVEVDRDGTNRLKTYTGGRGRRRQLAMEQERKARLRSGG